MLLMMIIMMVVVVVVVVVVLRRRRANSDNADIELLRTLGRCATLTASVSNNGRRDHQLASVFFPRALLPGIMRRCCCCSRLWTLT